MGKMKILPISIRIWLRVLREFSGVLLVGSEQALAPVQSPKKALFAQQTFTGRRRRLVPNLPVLSVQISTWVCVYIELRGENYSILIQVG